MDILMTMDSESARILGRFTDVPINRDEGKPRALISEQRFQTLVRELAGRGVLESQNIYRSDYVNLVLREDRDGD